MLAALQRIGWRIVRTRFVHHDKEELGPVILAEIAKHTGLMPEDL